MINAREFTDRLAELLRKEHGAMADFLLALAEFDRQKLWIELGHSGLFSFLHRELGLSKAGAYYRKTAAELVQTFPEVIEPLRDGRLCITAVVELAKVITADNRAEVLPRFFHCSKREAKAISAAIAPEDAPPRRDVVTALYPEPPRADAVHLDEPTQSQTSGPPANGHALTAGSDGRSQTAVIVMAPNGGDAARTSLSPVPIAPRDQAEPLTAELRRLHVTVSSRFLHKLEAAKAALSHTHPGGHAEEILEAGLDLLLERQAKKNGIAERPQKKERPFAPNRVPARVRRAIWERDVGRCQWPLESGGVCGSTVRVQLDHIQPRALGGPSTIQNGRLLCAMHNDLAARREFGDDWMDRFTRRWAATSEHVPSGVP